MTIDRTRRTTFDDVADLYDEVRPRYPAQLIDDIIAFSRIPDRGRILEIGCGPSNAAMLSTLEPVVTVILAALFLNETPKPITLIGGGFILVAVVLLAQSELRRHPQSSLTTSPSGESAPT